jgi:hypothetical protein
MDYFIFIKHNNKFEFLCLANLLHKFGFSNGIKREVNGDWYLNKNIIVLPGKKFETIVKKYDQKVQAHKLGMLSSYDLNLLIDIKAKKYWLCAHHFMTWDATRFVVDAAKAINFLHFMHEIENNEN